MRNFILGVIITLLVLVAGGLCLALLGFVHTNADATCASGKQPSAPDRRQHYRRHEAVYDELRGVSRRARQQAEPAGPFPVSSPSAIHPRADG